MTPRQVQGLLKIIRRADLIDFYNSILSYAVVHDKKLCSLDEFLALTSSEEKKEPKAFDETTDRLLEAEALKRLNERRAKVNG